MDPDSILLVEDSDDDLYFFERAYRKAGMTKPLVVARDGAEAVGHFSGANAEGSELPALVLLDLKLPRVGGHEVLRAIRQADPLRRTIVLCLTGSHEPSDRRRAYEEGANGYLLKPSSMDEIDRLLQSIKGYWMDHNVSPPSPAAPPS